MDTSLIILSKGRGFFFSVGNVIGAQGGNLPVVLGVLIFLTALWLIFSAVFVLRGSGGSALGVGLICFGLLFAAIITDGRVAAGLDAGGASRYTTFDLLTLVGCYLILLSRRSAGAREPRPENFSVHQCGHGRSGGLPHARSGDHQRARRRQLLAELGDTSVTSHREHTTSTRLDAGTYPDRNPFRPPDETPCGFRPTEPTRPVCECIDGAPLCACRAPVRSAIAHGGDHESEGRRNREGYRGALRVRTKRLRHHVGRL